METNIQSASPLVVSYGAGTNSVAILVGLKERDMRPDLIMFADTGDELPKTYRHIEWMQSWCRGNGFPAITVVKNELPQGIVDGSLSNQCMRLGTLPSKVFGRSSCSLKWKIEPQYQHLKRWMALNDISHVVHVVGYDADESHRANKPVPLRPIETTWYPLIEWDWGREECVAAIERAGIPQPGKSACFMCPSSKKAEVAALRDAEPELYRKAIEMERMALAGEGQAPAARVKGLGRHWNWASFAGNDIATPEIDCGCVG